MKQGFQSKHGPHSHLQTASVRNMAGRDSITFETSKLLFDKIFAVIALLLLLPLFAVVAISIKATSRGPVFFRQPRIGLNGKEFMIYKFRSMVCHQDEGKNGLTQATRTDPRVTPCGAFLRRTSIDELPQFINVLLGDMSVVGPRPHAVQHDRFYSARIKNYRKRHYVKPGITGWAQIHGLRGETDTVDKMRMRVQYDLHYLRYRSFWLDLRIVAWTAFKGWSGTNTY